MKNLTPILSHPLARARVGEMCEQVRADRDRRRHEKPWWNSNEDDGQDQKGCAAALLPASILLYVAGWAAIHFLL